MVKYDAYIICTSTRSGSTLLCDLLSSTEVCGKPESYFHSPSISSWYRHLNSNSNGKLPEPDVLDEIFKLAISAGSGDTGIFGLRMQGGSFSYFSRKLAVLHPGLTSDNRRIEETFGRTAFIHLTRLDKIKQAVSWVKAKQTGLWHMAPDGTELERNSPPQKLAYDADAIKSCIRELTDLDRQWKSWFAKQRIDPLLITYEALSEQPIDSLRRVLVHLNVDGNAANRVEPGVAKMADKTSQDWVTRFLAQ